MRIGRFAVFAMVGVIASGLLAAQPATKPGPTTRPSTGPGSGEFTVDIIELNGTSEVRADPDSRWRKPVVGDRLREGSQIRMGPRSSMKLRSNGDEVFTVERLGTWKVERGMGKTPAKGGVLYGRTRYDIAEGGVEHESTLYLPSSTLVIRGQRVVIDQSVERNPSTQPTSGPATRSLQTK